MIASQTFLAIGAPQIVLIVVAVLLLFGGKKIPELMRGLGSGIKEFKDASKEDDDKLEELAQVFGAPFIFYSSNISKSFRKTCQKAGIPILLFEGGKSSNIDNTITNIGVNGIKRVLYHLNMLNRNFKASQAKNPCICLLESKWIRAKYSGMFKATVIINSEVKKGDVLGNITDPYGSFNHFVKAPNDGYIFNINESPIIYQGDAIFHISIKVKA